MESLIASIVIDIGGLVLIWFLLRARIARTLEIDGLLAEARKEARLLTIEINETTDRNITLVEDRLTALRELLSEADRRIGVARRETGRRQAEGEVYNRLGRRLPLRSDAFSGEGSDGVVSLMLGEQRAAARDGQEMAEGDDRGEPVSLPLGPRLPEIVTSSASVIPPRGLRERAIELHRSGFSADIIAARLGATVSEIELLVSLEEGRSGMEEMGGT